MPLGQDRPRAALSGATTGAPPPRTLPRPRTRYVEAKQRRCITLPIASADNGESHFPATLFCPSPLASLSVHCRPEYCPPAAPCEKTFKKPFFILYSFFLYSTSDLLQMSRAQTKSLKGLGLTRVCAPSSDVCLQSNKQGCLAAGVAQNL